ncbi:MAG: undecaprenyl-diphosphate phosphatase [Caulobacterales bacterium]|nr:undecaprenyl-diphosphate phosphatase [Caulobacterales bacterium]
MPDWLSAIVLGLVEGLTEFIPVSSTGHLLLAKTALGLQGPTWDTFVVLIQLGAILAVVALYFQRLWSVLVGLPTSAEARRFALSILIAFLPAVVLGLALHDFIKAVLFESPAVICWSLLIGGVVLLVIDRFAPEPRYKDSMKYPWLTSLGIGVFQCLSMVPGVSRSGSTIVGALLLGGDKRSAAEFSFFLAIPTMVAAFAYDLYKSRDLINMDSAGLIAIGFVVSFLSGLVVIKTMLAFVAKRGYGLFGWWRIIVGGGGLLLLTFAH